MRYPPTFCILTDGARFDEVAKDLAHEEWVAISLSVHGAGQFHSICIEALAQGRLHQGDYTSVVETYQVNPRDTVQPMKFCQCGDQGIGVRKLVVSIGADDHHSHGRFDRHQMAEQRQTSFVGPLQVVKDQHHELILRDPGQHLHHRSKEQVALGVSVSCL